MYTLSFETSHSNPSWQVFATQPIMLSNLFKSFQVGEPPEGWMDSASYMDNNRDLVQVQACTSCFMHCMICMHDVSLLLASKTNTDPTWSAPHNQEQGCCHWPHHETSKCCATMSTTIGGTYRHNTHRDIQSHTHIQTYKHTNTFIHTYIHTP